jgi:hypothetical protein
MPETVFEIYERINRIPFLVQKEWWNNRYAIAICDISTTKSGYLAKGFSISFDGVKMAFVYSNYLDKFNCWNKYLIVPASHNSEWIEMPYVGLDLGNIMKVFGVLQKKLYERRNSNNFGN